MNVRALSPVSVVSAVSLVAILSACGHDKAPSRFPARPAGCAVESTTDAPTVPTDNIGTVSARCSDAVAGKDCERTLADQVCKLGGDMIWGVTGETTAEGGATLKGRAVKKR